MNVRKVNAGMIVNTLAVAGMEILSCTTGRDTVRTMITPVHRLTLASASPRRKDLLAQIGIDAIVAPSHADESSVSLAALRDSGQSAENAPAQLALHRARLKARSAELRPGTIGLLAADTVVTIDGASLEKPRDAADARDMLAQLSGREHYVHTAVVFVPEHSESVEEHALRRLHFSRWKREKSRSTWPPVNGRELLEHTASKVVEARTSPKYAEATRR